MSTIILTCDRCGNASEGLRLAGHVAGFYTRPRWAAYMNADERVVCATCMQNDVRYRRDYRRVGE